MLPFIKKRYDAGLIVKTRSPDKIEHTEPQVGPSPDIMPCAADLLAAIEAKDVKAIAQAISDAFAILDAVPHAEGEHTEASDADAGSYEARNKASNKF